MRSRFLTFTLALPALAGCFVGTINGEIDGDVVPAFTTGMVFEANRITDADDTLAIAALYTFSNGCPLVAQQLDVKADFIRGLATGQNIEDLQEDVRTLEEDSFPEDYWAAYVLLSGSKANDIEDTFDIETDTGDVVVCHHKGPTDAPRDDPLAAAFPDFLSFDEKDANRDCFTTSEGEVRVSVYDGKRISLEAELELVDDEKDDAGEVVMRAAGTHCPEVEDAMDGLLDELEDLVESRQGT